MTASTEILNASQAVLQATASGSAPGAAGDVDPVLVARDVFQDSDFWWKRLEPGIAPGTSWLQTVWNAILDVLGRIWEAIWRPIARILRLLFGGFSGASSGGSWLVWIVALAILVWAIWKLLPMIVQWLRADAPRVRPEAVASQSLPAAADLREQAQQALRDGRHAEAIRLALLALIAALEKQGLVRYDKTRTNREYRAELFRQPELATRFGRLARIYEGVWYGPGTAGREQAEESILLCVPPINVEGPSPG
jgi:Domain of unknown function (DUF4129)